MNGAAIAAIRSIQGKPSQIAARQSGARMTAETTRTSNPRKSRGTSGALAADAAIAPFASPEFDNGLLEMALLEIGPERVHEHELCVGTLPKQEIADALFAAGSDQQVGIRHAGGQKLPFEPLVIDLVGIIGYYSLVSVTLNAFEIPLPEGEQSPFGMK